jgi:hypothetical protein
MYGNRNETTRENKSDPSLIIIDTEKVKTGLNAIVLLRHVAVGGTAS